MKRRSPLLGGGRAHRRPARAAVLGGDGDHRTGGGPGGAGTARGRAGPAQERPRVVYRHRGAARTRAGDGRRRRGQREGRPLRGGFLRARAGGGAQRDERRGRPRGGGRPRQRHAVASSGRRRAARIAPAAQPGGAHRRRPTPAAPVGGGRGRSVAAPCALDRAGPRLPAWELRAATSLATLWKGGIKSHDSRTLLAGVLGCFTEGADTADVRKARLLLAELG